MQDSLIFNITPRAAEQVFIAAKQSGTTGMALRLAAKQLTDGSIDYGMGFDDLREGDVHIVTEGVSIVFEPTYTTLLSGATMDYVELEQGDFRFIFLNPNDPHYVPPQGHE